MSRIFFSCLAFGAAALPLAAAGCGPHDAPAAPVSRPVPAVNTAPPATAAAPAAGSVSDADRYKALMQQHPEHPANARN